MKIPPSFSFSVIAMVSAVGITQASPSIAQVGTVNRNVFFRTQNYGVQITWRGGGPYMTVSNNGWRVMLDAPATILPLRGAADNWTTYTAVSGDYRATVRVSPTGAKTIAVTLAGKRITEEYAKTSSIQTSPSLAKLPEQDSTVLEFQTEDYAVRVYRQKGDLWMNLYNRQQRTVDLKQVPVTLVNTSDATVYRHDGKVSVQAREDVRGVRSLYLIQDNQIQYRGEGY